MFTVGTIVFIIFFTTTLVIIVLTLADTFDLEDYISNKVGRFLTRAAGLNIKFESVNGNSLWNDGHIVLKK